VVTHRTSSDKAENFAATVSGTHQQNQQNENYGYRRAGQKVFSDPISFFGDPFLCQPICHHQNVARKKDHPDQ